MASNDAVMWVKANHKGQFRKPKVWDEAKKRWITPVDEFDRPLLERVPAKGWVGNDMQNMRPMKGERAVRMLTMQGNEVDCPLSSGASLPMREDEHKAERLRKFRYYGWVPVGCCTAFEGKNGPRRGGVSKAKLLSKEAREGTPCDENDLGGENPPCPHYLAEVKARRAHQAKCNAKENINYAEENSENTKQIGRLIEGQNKLIEKLADSKADAK
jgi:hypothetical protein